MPGHGVGVPQGQPHPQTSELWKPTNLISASTILSWVSATSVRRLAPYEAFVGPQSMLENICRIQLHLLFSKAMKAKDQMFIYQAISVTTWVTIECLASPRSPEHPGGVC